MAILNIGNRIECGEYSLYSVFEKVNNFIREDKIIALVTESIGKGPNNIVVNNVSETNYRNITINPENIIIGEKEFLRVQKNNSSQLKYINDKKQLLAIIENLNSDLLLNFAPTSLGFLLFPEFEAFFKTGFQKSFLNKIKSIKLDFKKGNILSIATQMKGLGFGLTPSGDDFNCGVMYALNYLQAAFDFEFPDILKSYYDNSLGENALSNNFLRFAYLNEYYEFFQKLLIAMYENKQENINKYLIKVLNTGSTSGSDTLTGFILTIKGVLND